MFIYRLNLLSEWTLLYTLTIFLPFLGVLASTCEHKQWSWYIIKFQKDMELGKGEQDMGGEGGYGKVGNECNREKPD